MNKIVESCRFVSQNSGHVKINFEKIDTFCDSFEEKQVSHVFDEAPFDIQTLSLREIANFLLLYNSLNFSYWGEPKWKMQYHNMEFDGAYGMIASIARALEQCYPVLDAKFLSEITKTDFEKILEGNVQIPLFEERWNIWKDVGAVLLRKFKGDFINILSQSQSDAQKLLDLIIENFSSFEDSAMYKGEKIYFYKRAQLLVADIIQTLSNTEFGNWKNVHELTACADYKLPFVLRRLGIFSYSDILTQKIDHKIQIVYGSEEEIELRANTIWVVELMKEKIKQKFSNIDSIQINDHLWLLGQEKFINDRPYHLTRTTAY